MGVILTLYKRTLSVMEDAGDKIQWETRVRKLKRIVRGRTVRLGVNKEWNQGILAPNLLLFLLHHVDFESYFLSASLRGFDVVSK